MRSRVKKAQIFGVGLALLMTAMVTLIVAQGFNSSLNGTITDPSGAAVPGAEIFCKSRTTDQSWTVTSNQAGEFSIPSLPSGLYDLSVVAEGFGVKTINAIEVRPSRAQSVHVVVELNGPASVRPDGNEFPSAPAAAPPPPPPPPPSPPSPPSPPPATAHRTMSDPIWNVWSERSSTPSFEPVNIQAGKDYGLVVNLAAVDYRQLEGTAVYSQDVTAGFVKWAKDNSDLDAADIDIRVDPDKRYFSTKGQQTKSLHVNLKKLRATESTGFDLDGSPFAYLRSHAGDAPFSFGIQYFQLRALSNAPLGNAPVALSIWADGKPIDDISVNLCVAPSPSDSCPTSSAGANYSLRGVDLSGKGTLPDAALQLIERGDDVVGVFRCNSCTAPNYISWTIGQQADGWLANRVTELVQHLTPPVPSQDYFAQTGDTLYNLIFPNSRDPDEAAAEAAFKSFFSLAHAKGAVDAPSSLFVRLLSREPNLMLFPIGLMRVPLPDGTKEFLGYSVNVEAPLELQDYSIPVKCISDWVLFVPPSGTDQSLGDLVDARAYASDWIDSVAKLCPTCVYSEPGKFSDWLLEDTQSAAPTTSEALVVLSQYRNNSLFFNGSADSPPLVLSASIRRNFATPSLAVLDACGTAAPGGSEFIRMLNAHGVSSIVSTSAAIPGAMGGKFLQLFISLLTSNPTYTVSRARYEAVKALGGSYGPQALVFSLVGNGSLRVCMPSK